MVNKLNVIRCLCFCLVILMLSVGCSKLASNSMETPFYSVDPYLSSFWGRNIAMVMRDNAIGSLDTLRFNELGDMIEEQGIGGPWRRRGFDDYHRLTRLWDGGGI